MNLEDIIDQIPNYELTEEEKTIVLSTYFKQVSKDIENLERPEVAVLWGTLVLKPKKVEQHIRMIDKIIESPIEKIKEKNIVFYKTKQTKLKSILSIYTKMKENGKTSRSKKREINNN